MAVIEILKIRTASQEAYTEWSLNYDHFLNIAPELSFSMTELRTQRKTEMPISDQTQFPQQLRRFFVHPSLY